MNQTAPAPRALGDTPAGNVKDALFQMSRSINGLAGNTGGLGNFDMTDAEDRKEYAARACKLMERFGETIAEDAGILAGSLVDGAGNGDATQKDVERMVRDMFRKEINPAMVKAVTR